MGMIGTSSQGSRRRVPRNNQRVLINKFGDWQWDPEVLCESVSLGVGTTGCSANFSVPKLLWDQAGSRFTGAEVLVYASENGSTQLNADPWFHGWIVGEPKRRGPRANNYAISAISVIRLMDKIPCGLGGWTYREWDGSVVRDRTIQSTCPRYPRLSAMRGGVRRTLWHPRDIAHDVFESLPSFWAQAVRLGNTDVLREEPFRKKGLVEWDFTGVSTLEALQTLVSAWGNVGFVERFHGTTLPRVSLDFFTSSDPLNGRKVFTVPECGSSEIGIKEIGGSTEVADRVDRVILAGLPYRVMVTVWTGDVSSVRRLRKGWIVKPVTITQTFLDEDTNTPSTRDVTKTNEEWVLDDPDYGRRGSDLFEADCEWCFRRYYLPPCLLAEGLTIEKDNAVRQLQADPGDEPKRIPRQAFKTRLTYSTRRTDYEIAESLIAKGQLSSSYGYDCAGEYAYGYGYESSAGFRLLNLSAADLVGELIEDDLGDGAAYPLQAIDGFDVGDDGVVVLNEPATNVIFKGYCGNKEQVIRAEADVAITITIGREERLTVDTGQPPYNVGNLALIGGDGSILSDVKDEWEYSQVTSLGNGPRLENGVTITFPFHDPSTGAEVHFDWCVYQNVYDPDADDETVASQQDNEINILTHAFSQQVVRNDYAVMRELARRMLKLGSRVKRTFEIGLPNATKAFLPGDVVNVNGAADLPFEDYAVGSVDIRFDPTGTAFGTVVTINNGRIEESIRLEG
jgi:hypothetical protein